MSTLSHIYSLRVCRVTLPRARHKPHAPSFSLPVSSNPRLTHQRSFHAAQLYQATQDVILSVHSITGTPWGITIPLIAVIVNCLFRLPFTIHSQRLASRRLRAAPVLQAWILRGIRDLQHEKVPQDRMVKVGTQRYAAETKRVYARLGLQQWKMYSAVLGVPFWLLTLDGIRRLCGLGPLFGGLGGDGASSVPSPATISASTSQTTTGLATEGASNLGDPSAIVGETVPDIEHIISQSFEPSLVTEGMLWFTDLTVADPYHILPFAVGAVMAANIIPRDPAMLRAALNLTPKSSGSQTSGENNPTVIQQGGGWRLALLRSMLLFCGAVPFVTASFPAAMHLYWFTSAATTLAFKSLVTPKHRMKVGKVKMCKGREIPVIRPKIMKTTEMNVKTGQSWKS
ncbi:hypothetical protein BJ170DRAFT_619688 [Xylariales sp. AK1849]|nr:hypothetical protein BJ170DRAFT_619688 [Xylariales sp. AK1849]